LIAAVLKTALGKTNGGSNPSLSANKRKKHVYVRVTKNTDASPKPLGQFNSDYAQQKDVNITVMNETNFSIPVLHESSTEWYIDFNFRNPETGKFVRFKRTEGLQRCATDHEKRIHGAMLIAKYHNKLAEGWNPFKDMRKAPVVNHLAYKHVKRKEYDPDYNIIFWMNRYIQSRVDLCARDKSVSTYASKMRFFQKFIERKKISHLIYTAITVEHARLFANELLSGDATGKKLSPKTFNAYIQTLRSMWNWLAEENENVNLSNIWKKIKLMKINPFPRVLTFSQQQRNTIFEHLMVHDKWLYIVCRMIYKTYIRPGREMTGLRIRDFDFADGKIWIPADISKNKKMQWVPMPNDIKEWLMNEGVQNLAPSLYIFGKDGPSHVPASRDHWSKRFDKYKKILHIAKGQSIYVFKHTGNMVARKNGMDIVQQMQHNRHHSLDEMRAYLRSIDAGNPDDVDRYITD